MRAFPVVMPSRQRYRTVLDDDLEVVPVADHWLGRSWPDAGRDLGLFMVWLKYTPAPRDGSRW